MARRFVPPRGVAILVGSRLGKSRSIEVMSDEQRNGESQAKRVRWRGIGARLLKLSAVACCLGIASLFIASGLSPELRDQAPKKDSEALAEKDFQLYEALNLLKGLNILSSLSNS